MVVYFGHTPKSIFTCAFFPVGLSSTYSFLDPNTEIPKNTNLRFLKYNSCKHMILELETVIGNIGVPVSKQGTLEELVQYLRGQYGFTNVCFPGFSQKDRQKKLAALGFYHGSKIEWDTEAESFPVCVAPNKIVFAKSSWTILQLKEAANVPSTSLWMHGNRKLKNDDVLFCLGFTAAGAKIDGFQFAIVGCDSFKVYYDVGKSKGELLNIWAHPKMTSDMLSHTLYLLENMHLEEEGSIQFLYEKVEGQLPIDSVGIGENSLVEWVQEEKESTVLQIQN